VATVKGLALGASLPAVGVSTLEAMAWNLEGMDADLCCCMDARAGQVYNARFHISGDVLTRLTPDRAITIDELGAEIGQTPQILVGDGAELCYNKLYPLCSGVSLAPPLLRYPLAYGVSRAALPLFAAGKTCSAQELDACYLRPPQAERIRLEKQKETEPSQNSAS
jgi:tRNA threonylcarbamoyladenosine biosynthesis protein TsaB